MTDVLILGAGFAGLELATRLSEANDDFAVTLIDANDSFFLGFSKLDVLFKGQTSDDARMYYRDLNKPGVTFRQERVTAIDPANRRVTTDASTYEPDYLVVALGADYAPEATPGFVERGFEFYTMEGAERLRGELATFTSGKIVLAVLGLPFKCPPAPFECAVLLHDHFAARGPADAVEITMVTPMPSPIPVSKETSEALVGELDRRGIRFIPEELVTSIEDERAMLRSGGALPYDLFIGVPVHKTPDVVQSSGLTEGGTDGWVKVDRANLRTPYDRVYALGDIADAPVPRAGVFAENEAGVVADDIISRVRSEESKAIFDGRGTCYIEFGGGRVGKVEVDFLSGPTPVAPFFGPSIDLAEEKEAFGTSRRARWFG